MKECLRLTILLILLIVVIFTVSALFIGCKNDLNISADTENIDSGNSPGIPDDIYYVSKIGSDGNPGTEAQPWLTIQQAANKLTPGDTVYVMSGIYNEKVTIMRSGSANKFVSFKVYPGEKVIIDGTGLGITNGLVFGNNASYIRFEGFEVANSAVDGVRWTGSNYSHIQLVNIYSHEHQESGILFMHTDVPPTNIVIDGCEIYRTNASGEQEAITLREVVHYEIKNCYIHNILGTESYHGFQKEGICPKTGSRSGLIHDNIIDNARVGIYTGGRDSNTGIFNNLISNCEVGIGIATESSPFSSRIDVYNNVIFDCGSGIALDLGFKNQEEDIIMVNNTIYGCGRSFNMYGSTYSACVVRNNIIYGTSDDADSRYGIYGILYNDYPSGEITIDHNLFFNSVGNFNKNNILGTDALMADPVLADVIVYNFQLTAGSLSAINKGSANLAPTVDKNAVGRVGLPDIGAYEYVTSDSK